MDTEDDVERALEESCQALLDKLQDIDRQLSERKPVDELPDGEFREWRRWRSSAIHAKSKTLQEYREKKAELKAYRRDKSAAAQDYLREEVGPESIIRDLISVAVECGAYANPRHEAVLTKARTFLGQDNRG